MKRMIAILLASVAAVHADTLTYTFDSGLGATGTSDATATNTFYTPGSNADGSVAATAQRAWYDQDASGDDVYWLSGRLTDNKGTDDADLDMTLGAPSYISFPLEIAPSNQLDFAGATLDLTGTLYNDSGISLNMAFQIWAKPDGGTWDLIGAKQIIYGPAPSTNMIGTIYEVDEVTRPIANDGTLAGTIEATVSNLTFDISSLGLVGQGQGVEIAVAMSGTRDNQNSFCSSLDDVVISNFTVSVVTGPPTYTGTLYLGDGIDSYTNSPATWDSTSANWGLISDASSTPWTNWISGSDVVIGVPAVNMETGATFNANKLSWNYDNAITLSGDGSTVLTVSNQISCLAPTARQLTLDAGTIGGNFSLLNLSRLSFNTYGVEPDTHITTDLSSDIQFGTGAPADFSDLSVTLGGANSLILDLGGVDRTMGSLTGIGGIQVASNTTTTITQTSMGGSGSVGSLLANGTSVGNLQLGSGTHLFDLIPGTTSSDHISIGSGSLTFGGDLIVQATTATELALGDRFQLFEAGAYAGAFNSVTLPTNNLPAGAIFFNDLATDGSFSVGTAGIKYSVIRFDQFLNTSTWVSGGVTMFGSITNAAGTVFTLTASAKNPVGEPLYSNREEYIQGIDSAVSSNNVSYRFDSGNFLDPSDDEQVQFSLSMSGAPVDSLDFSAIDTFSANALCPIEILDANSTSITIHSNINTIIESDLTGLEVLTKNNVDTWSLDLIARERSDGELAQWSIDYVEFIVQYQIGSSFDIWSDSYGLVEGPDGDDDKDGVSNLYEYGLNGNPTNAAIRGDVEFGASEDGSSFIYTYARRTAANSGIDYSLATSENLVYDNAWTNNDTVVDGIGPEVDGFDTVTNSTATDIGAKFIQLFIEEN